MREIAVALVMAASLAACANTAQVAANTDAMDFALDPVAFSTEGVGFLTPISATGQEANRMALALAFTTALTDTRDDLHVVSLAEVLSSVNRAGLAAAYKAMMADYAATGIMERETLRQVGQISDARYLCLLELADFEQSVNKRFSIGGLRLLDTKLASIRVSWQIWDSLTGGIAWEGSEEIHYAYDTGRERPVTFALVADKAAENLIARIPSLEANPERTTAVSLAR